jgi:hypothetical protein
MSKDKSIDDMIDEAFEVEDTGIVAEEAEHFQKFMGMIEKSDNRMKTNILAEGHDYETGDRPARKYDKRYRERPLNSIYWGKK